MTINLLILGFHPAYFWFEAFAMCILMVLWTTTLPLFEEILVYSFGPMVHI